MTGALLGLAVGLLVAPEKGEDTRDSLADNYEKLKDKFLRLTGRAGARMDDLRALLGKEVEGISDDVRARINTILDEEGAKAGSGNGSTLAASNEGSGNTDEGSRAGRSFSEATAGGGSGIR